MTKKAVKPRKDEQARANPYDAMSNVIKSISDKMKTADQYETDKDALTDLKSAMDKVGLKQTTKTPRTSLIKYIIDFINNTTLEHKEQLKQVLTQIGELFTKKINKNDSTQLSSIKPIRQAIINKYGKEEARDIIINSKISDSTRSRIFNKRRDAAKLEEHKNPYLISIEEVKQTAENIKNDLDKFPDNIILLFELCAGCRPGEAMKASKFKPSKNGSYIQQTGILKKDKVGLGRDDVDESEEDSTIIIKKPVLFYKANWLIDTLKEWRNNLKIKWIKLGTEIKPHYDQAQYNSIRNGLSQRLKSKYSAFKDVDSSKLNNKILRKFYAVASYHINGGNIFNKVYSFQLYIKEVLGHDFMETGRSYSHVVIIDDKTRQPLKYKEDKAEAEYKPKEDDETKDEIIKRLLEENQTLKDQVKELKQKLKGKNELLKLK